MGLKEHRHTAPTSVSMSIITLTDSRSREEDTTGQMIYQMLSDAGHQVTDPEIIPEDRPAMTLGLERVLEDDRIQGVILNGGTGVASRDITPEVVRPFLDKELPGFGELFRHLSYQEIGSAALLSRALAGIARKKVIFVLPGSRNACRLALEKLILPELGHLVGEALKDPTGTDPQPCDSHAHHHEHAHQHQDQQHDHKPHQQQQQQQQRQGYEHQHQDHEHSQHHENRRGPDR